jgi:hypothetical protein
MTEQEIEQLFDAAFGFSMPKEGESRRVVREDILTFANSLLQAQQVRIDALMLEFCHDEMTEEQIKTWGENQKPVKVFFSDACDLSGF